ncbi:hypothetical protein C8Q80DRAFT_1173914 [Daedaleopsis nitida]|nr:hypothetical protein C8Q80DRAFT_1173914 [Daedaleopsis nitida]
MRRARSCVSAYQQIPLRAAPLSFVEMHLQLGKNLGIGGFGRAFSGSITSGPRAGKVIAVKRSYIRPNETKYPHLRHEAYALHLVRGHPSIP